MEFLTENQATHIKGLLLSNTELITNIYQIDIINEALDSVTLLEEDASYFDEDINWNLESGESFDDEEFDSGIGQHDQDVCNICNDELTEDEYTYFDDEVKYGDELLELCGFDGCTICGDDSGYNF